MTDNTTLKQSIDHRKNRRPFSKKNELARIFWNITYLVLLRPTPDFILNKYRIFILKLFGAKIGAGSVVYPSTKIWAPWNLEVGEYTCIGPHTDIYSMDKIIIGNHVTISQNAVLCAATHDINSHSMRLLKERIIIDDYAWVCAYAKILPGLRIREGAVIGLGCVLGKAAEAWFVYAGNPAKKIKSRAITND